MPRGVIMLLALMISALPARAQLLEKPKQSQTLFFTIPQDEPETETEKPDSTALAMQYFDRCMNTAYQDLSETGRGDFCMCSASAARGFLSEEELAYLATGEGSGEIRYFDADAFGEKLDREVNAPCVYLAIREIERTNCLASDKIQHFFVTQNAYDVMCDCLAGGIADFAKDYAGDMLAVVRKRYPKASSDPAAAIRQWTDYKVELGKVTKQCLNMYGHK